MKKLLASLLVLTISLGMIVCGQGNQPASFAANADGSWDKMGKAGILIAELDDAFLPMGYKDTNTDELAGFDIDLVKEACKRLGVELKLQSIDWSNKQAELDNSNVGCLWNGFNKTPERVEAIALSIPCMSNNQIVLVRTESTYKTLKDLDGRVVDVQGNSSAEAALNAVGNEEFKSSLKNVTQIDDYTKAILEIQNGVVDAISIDEVVACFYLKNQPGSFRILENGGMAISLASEDYVVGMHKNDLTLKDKIDETLRAMAKDGTMTTISGKWSGKDVAVVDVK